MFCCSITPVRTLSNVRKSLEMMVQNPAPSKSHFWRDKKELKLEQRAGTKERRWSHGGAMVEPDKTHSYGAAESN